MKTKKPIKIKTKPIIKQDIQVTNPGPKVTDEIIVRFGLNFI
jgi:hypothetical protein